MTTPLKIILGASLLAFLASLTDTGSALAWGALKPVSAILFLVFYIGQLLHKEVVKYDEETELRLRDAGGNREPAEQRNASPTRRGHSSDPLPSAAH